LANPLASVTVASQKTPSQRDTASNATRRQDCLKLNFDIMLAFSAIVISLMLFLETGLGQMCQPALSIRLRAFQGAIPGNELWLGPFANNGSVVTDREEVNYVWVKPASYNFRFDLNRARTLAQLVVSQMSPPQSNSASIIYSRIDLPSKIQLACNGTTRLRGFRVSVFVQSGLVVVLGQNATVSLASLKATMDTTDFLLGDLATSTSNGGNRVTPPAVFLDVPSGHEEKSFTFDGFLSLSVRKQR
jgi:hypothetical protein